MMERGTDPEWDAQLLGTRHTSHPPCCVRMLRAGELALMLCAWALLIVAIVCDGRADAFDPAKVLHEVEPYEWRHTTVDAVLMVFLAASITAVAALSQRPLWGVVASTVALAACVAKRAMLDERAGGLRASSVVFCLASSCCSALTAIAHTLRRGKRRRASGRLDGLDSAVTSSRQPPLDDLEALSLSFVSVRSVAGAAASGGASVTRLLGTARPERRMLLMATVALMLSTLSQMTMPMLIGKLLSTVTTPNEPDPHGKLLQVGTEARSAARLRPIPPLPRLARLVRYITCRTRRPRRAAYTRRTGCTRLHVSPRHA